MNEFELIQRLTRDLPRNDSTRVGPGDDCAVLDLGVPGRWLLFKTDAVVEGVHFLPTADPRKVGHKALARCLSDVAAMAGTPTHALVTLGLPPAFEVDRLEAVYAGMSELARRYGVAIVGGETTASPERMFLSMAVLGWVEAERCPLRSGARPGDAIFVTGELGGSLISGRHLEFEPRLAEARWLVSRFSIHAMVDLSDGLAEDLRHVLEASKRGAELLAEAIPVRRESLLEAWGGTGRPPGHKPPLLAALTDGEDFELLFTLPAAEAVPLLDAWKAEFGNLRLSCVGRITGASGVTIRDRQGTRPLDVHGYVHFQKP